MLKFKLTYLLYLEPQIKLKEISNGIIILKKLLICCSCIILYYTRMVNLL